MTGRKTRRAGRALLVCCLALVALWGSLAGAGARPASAETARPTTQEVMDLTLTVDDFTGSDLWQASSETEAALGGRAGTLGGERDVTVRAGALRLAWDGDDGNAAQLQATGLGGADLSAGGLRDQFVLEVTGGSQPAQARLRAWRDEGNWSEATVMIPSGLTAPTRLVIPFSAFKTGVGQGVAWGDVGALELEIDGATPALTLRSLTVGSPVRVVRGETLLNDANGNGRADGGDRVARTVTLTNGAAETVRGLRWQESVPARQATLDQGSLRGEGGDLTHEAASGLLTLDVAALAPGAEATLRYEATLAGLTISVTVVTQDDQAPPGGNGAIIRSLNQPYTNGDGEVGFTGTISQSGVFQGFVWFDDAIIWRNSDSISPTLTGGEATMGIGNNGEFIYSPTAAGDDAVWSQNGLVLRDGDPAPDFPAGTVTTFHSRPTMLPNGTAYWVAGYNPSGGTTSVGRMVYSSVDATGANATVVLRTDDVVGGFPISAGGISFDYQISDNALHHINNLILVTGSTANDTAVYLDGGVAAQEGSPTGQGDNWSNFDVTSVNDQGNYIFSGDTSGATTTDYFLAYNGTIQIREGDTIGGLPLTTAAAMRAGSINNLNQAAHLWGTIGTTGPEILYGACDASALATSTPLLVTGDQVDTNNDGTPDATVLDFNATQATAPGLWLAEDGMVYVNVDLNYGAGSLEAIIGVTLPCVGPPAITLSKTVGTDPSTCALTDVITLTVGGGDATYCYTVQNTGGVTLTTHDLTDSELGTILAGLSYDLPPGATAFVTATATITQTTVNTATWTASGTRGETATATDSATVIVTAAAPAITLSKTVGIDPSACAVTNVITVTATTDVTYCYTVQNVGNITLTTHDLTDSELGTLLSGFSYTLAPGATAFITATTTITETTVNTATWTAYNGSPTSPESATTNGSATVVFDIVTALTLTDLGSAPASRLPAALALLGAALVVAAALHRRRQ